MPHRRDDLATGCQRKPIESIHAVDERGGCIDDDHTPILDREDPHWPLA